MRRSGILGQALQTISVEPVIFCNALAISYHNVVYKFGIYRVICQKLFDDESGIDCFDLGNYTTNGSRPELEVQRAASDWNMQLVFCYMIPATIADIMLGAMGDRYGRKVNLLMGIFGMMVAVFPVALMFSFPHTMPMFVLQLAYVVAGFSGFVSIVVISAWAYLADTVVDRDLLTVRMTIVQVCVNMGSIFGPLLASATSRVLKNSIQEVVALCLLAMAFVVGLVLLRQVPPAEMRRRMLERRRKKEPAEGWKMDPLNGKDGNAVIAVVIVDKPENGTENRTPSGKELGCEQSAGGEVRNEQSGDAVATDGKAVCDAAPTIANAVTGETGLAHRRRDEGSATSSPPASSTIVEPPLDPSPSSDQTSSNSRFRISACWTVFVQLLRTCGQLCREIWHTYTKPRPGHARAYILTASLVVLFSMAAELGLRASIFSLYVQKAPLSWSQDMIGYYDSANNAVTMAATIAGIFVFKKLLGWNDTTVVLIALASGTAESLLIAFGDRTWMLFLSAFVGCLSSLVKPCVKSFVAKLVEPDEVGKAFTIFGISQNVAYLLSAVIYTNIYKATLETFPGFVYVLSAIIFVFIFGSVVWIHFDQRRAEGHRIESVAVVSKVWNMMCKQKSSGRDETNEKAEPTVVAL